MSKHKPKCRGEVPNSGGWGWVGCSNTGKIERDGKFYCGIHDPVKIKERQDKSRARWDANQAAWLAKREEERERDRRADLFPELLAAAEAVLEWQLFLYNEDAAQRNVPPFREWLGNNSLGPLYDAVVKTKGGNARFFARVREAQVRVMSKHTPG